MGFRRVLFRSLIAVMLDKRLLHRVRSVRCPKALDRHDVVVVMLHRQAEAAVDPPSARDHRAGAALSVIAALFRARQAQMLAQCVEERRARIEFELPGFAVDTKRSEEHTSELQSLMRNS